MISHRIRKLEVFDLFGYLNHEVEIRDGVATILTGPNGSGKTHVLIILKCLVALDFEGLRSQPFGLAQLSYKSNWVLRVDSSEDEEGAYLVVTGRDNHGRHLGEYIHRQQPLQRRGIPPWIRQVGPAEWLDTEDNEYLTTRQVQELYGSPSDEAPPWASEPWLEAFTPDIEPIFIETGRLDTAFRPPPSPARRVVPRREPETAIERYVEQIRYQVTEARRTSLSVSQRADRQFAARALDRARESLREPDLRARFESIAKFHQELHANGLTEETIAVAFPQQRTNPTERRILNLFLEDWEDKLAPLEPVHRKLQALRGVVEAKLRDKEMLISARGAVTFRTPTGGGLAVDLLSSGEQHMLALFTMLLFSAEPGALVLIDEPEISLHAAWKHSFLDDLEAVAELMPVKVIMATHSAGLINGRWDLVEELGVME